MNANFGQKFELYVSFLIVPEPKQNNSLLRRFIELGGHYNIGYFMYSMSSKANFVTSQKAKFLQKG